MFACFTTPDQLKPKRHQPIRRDDAMIFWPRARLITEIGLNLRQPGKITLRREDHRDPPDLRDIACSRDRTDTALQIADERVDDFRHHMRAGLTILIEQVISSAEVE